MLCVHQGFGTLLMEEAERISREEHGSGESSLLSVTDPDPVAFSVLGVRTMFWLPDPDSYFFLNMIGRIYFLLM